MFTYGIFSIQILQSYDTLGGEENKIENKWIKSSGCRDASNNNEAN